MSTEESELKESMGEPGRLIIGTIISVKGTCWRGQKKGDTFILSDTRTSGLCPHLSISGRAAQETSRVAPSLQNAMGYGYGYTGMHSWLGHSDIRSFCRASDRMAITGDLHRHRGWHLPIYAT